MPSHNTALHIHKGQSLPGPITCIHILLYNYVCIYISQARSKLQMLLEVMSTLEKSDLALVSSKKSLTLGRSSYLSNDCPQIMLQNRDKIKLRYIFPAKMSFNVFMTLSSLSNKDNFLMRSLYETLKMCYRYLP